MNKAILLISLMLSQSVLLAERVYTRVTPLFEATQRRDLAGMKTLIQQGADVNELGTCGDDEPWGYCDDPGIDEPPMFAAIRNGDSKAVDLLLAHGADPNISGSTSSGYQWGSNYTLTYAMRWKNQVIIEKLLQHGAYKSFGLRLTEEEQSWGGVHLPHPGALSYLLAHKHLGPFIPTLLEYRKGLVKKGLLKDIPDLLSQMLYMLLIKKPLSEALIAQLLKLGADVNWDLDEKTLPLEELWHDGLFAVPGKTLGLRALATPLHVIVDRAIYKDVPQSVIQLLLQHGASPHKKNSESKSPIDMAREAGREDLVKLLMSK